MSVKLFSDAQKVSIVTNSTIPQGVSLMNLLYYEDFIGNSRSFEISRDHSFFFYQNGLMRFTTAALSVMSKEKGGKGGVIVNTASGICEFSVYQIAM